MYGFRYLQHDCRRNNFINILFIFFAIELNGNARDENIRKWLIDIKMNTTITKK